MVKSHASTVAKRQALPDDAIIEKLKAAVLDTLENVYNYDNVLPAHFNVEIKKNGSLFHVNVGVSADLKETEEAHADARALASRLNHALHEYAADHPEKLQRTEDGYSFAKPASLIAALNAYRRENDEASLTKELTSFGAIR